jgi:GNAT superfamily N-acetyltransferase
MKIVPLTGDDLQAALPALARLRIEVFRAFPYLYEGDLEYEAEYLSALANARNGIIVAAYDGDDIVGCATGSGIDSSHEELIGPLRDAGIDLPSTFYNSESVLRASYRGRGIGHAFFDHREAHARARGYARACFCGVIRADDHPSKPEGYRPLDQFWNARGYAKVPQLIAHFEWRDIGDATETPKPMQFWMRDL